MAEKRIKGKALHKHELEAHWLKSTSYVPEKGELVVYDAEVDKEGNVLELPEGRETPYTYPRMKLGDGEHTVNELEFSGGAENKKYVDDQVTQLTSAISTTNSRLNSLSSSIGSAVESNYSTPYGAVTFDDEEVGQQDVYNIDNLQIKFVSNGAIGESFVSIICNQYGNKYLMFTKDVQDANQKKQSWIEFYTSKNQGDYCVFFARMKIEALENNVEFRFSNSESTSAKLYQQYLLASNGVIQFGDVKSPVNTTARLNEWFTLKIIGQKIGYTMKCETYINEQLVVSNSFDLSFPIENLFLKLVGAQKFYGNLYFDDIVFERNSYGDIMSIQEALDSKIAEIANSDEQINEALDAILAIQESLLGGQA